MKTNCWEFFGCGREPGGARVHELGICRASLEERVDGIHGGRNGGRCCWTVAGTFCGCKERGVFASKIANCIKCSFYKKVAQDEGKDLLSATDILARLT